MSVIWCLYWVSWEIQPSPEPRLTPLYTWRCLMPTCSTRWLPGPWSEVRSDYLAWSAWLAQRLLLVLLHITLTFPLINDITARPGQLGQCFTKIEITQQNYQVDNTGDNLLSYFNCTSNNRVFYFNNFTLWCLTRKLKFTLWEFDFRE